MDVWQLVLYAVAAFLALRSLISLMTHHRRRFRRQLVLEYQQQLEQQQRAESQAEKKAAEPEPAESAA